MSQPTQCLCWRELFGQWTGLSYVLTRQSSFRIQLFCDLLGDLALNYTSFRSFEVSAAFLPLASWILLQTAYLAPLASIIISWSNNQLCGTPVTSLCFSIFAIAWLGTRSGTRKWSTTEVVGSRVASKPQSWHPPLSTWVSKNNINRVMIKVRQRR